jgi:hypothetical protein
MAFAARPSTLLGGGTKASARVLVGREERREGGCVLDASAGARVLVDGTKRPPHASACPSDAVRVREVLLGGFQTAGRPGCGGGTLVLPAVVSRDSETDLLDPTAGGPHLLFGGGGGGTLFLPAVVSRDSEMDLDATAGATTDPPVLLVFVGAGGALRPAVLL